MLRAYIKWILFLSSYIPLYVIFLLKDLFSNPTFSWILVILIIFPFMILLVILQAIHTLEKNFTKIKKISYRNEAILSYIFTYIFPFLSINFSLTSDLIGIGIIFLLIGIFYTNSNLIYTNPILSLLGYNIFEAEDDQENIMLIITKYKVLRNNTKIKTINIGKNVYLGI